MRGRIRSPARKILNLSPQAWIAAEEAFLSRVWLIGQLRRQVRIFRARPYKGYAKLIDSIGAGPELNLT